VRIQKWPIFIKPLAQFGRLTAGFEWNKRTSLYRLSISSEGPSSEELSGVRVK
jgi:hypothetical protein